MPARDEAKMTACAITDTHTKQVFASHCVFAEELHEAVAVPAGGRAREQMRTSLDREAVHALCGWDTRDLRDVLPRHHALDRRLRCFAEVIPARKRL